MCFWRRRKKIYAKIKGDKSLEWLDEYFSECFRIMRENTAIYCFCSWHNVDAFKKSFEKYFKLKNVIIWVKNNHGSGDLKASYAPKHEFILYGNKGRKFLNGKRMEDVLFFNKTKNENHPTEKPVALLETLICNSSDKDALVFDGFMGSGSTCVAAINTNRKYIGFELDEEYFEIAENRINKALESILQEEGGEK